ncbi:MAG: RNA pseudouridine synthase [Chitinophagaceae bacterium]|nr:RNA pseudouridine synthase [Chitinophagaceae bacterium]
MNTTEHSRINWFTEEESRGISLPGKFTFPFYYEPHPLARLAAQGLQQYLDTQSDFDHEFGFNGDNGQLAIGKMFGVLVVQSADGRVGSLWGVSGKLANSNDHPRFVPPVFDMLTRDSFFLVEQENISAVNEELERALANEEIPRLQKEVASLKAQAAEEKIVYRQQMKANRDQRRLRREEQKLILSAADYAAFDAEMVRQSHYDQYVQKQLAEAWDARIAEVQAQLQPLEGRVEALRTERRERSGALQQRLFNEYSFLNIAGESRSVGSIFADTAFGRPPAGAGECATPKLLQYAFLHGLRPLAMAEFWWGAAPRSEVRQHGHFYPACAGKCKPILAHMLHGIPVDENPMLEPTSEEARLRIVYEDEHLLVVNKPAGLRSVPGVAIEDSVFSRLRDTRTDFEPLMIHRLDMGTSGLLVVAKSAKIHKHIQQQFLRRSLSKRYTALLSKDIPGEEGEIDLPLAADPYNRPAQMVCYETGKPSLTRWKVVSRENGITRIHFWPLTGRTHQLRMHAAHTLGLNAPILGDDIYGIAAERLYLHAAALSFTHPVSRQVLSFEVVEDF